MRQAREKDEQKSVVARRPPLVLVPSACFLVSSLRIKSQEQANHTGKIVLLVNRAIYVHAILSILQLRLICSRLSVGKEERNCGEPEKKTSENWGRGKPITHPCLFSFFFFLYLVWSFFPSLCTENLEQANHTGKNGVSCLNIADQALPRKIWSVGLLSFCCIHS